MTHAPRPFPPDAVKPPPPPPPPPKKGGIVFDEDHYLEELWECFANGVEEGLPEKDLFIALIENMLRQIKGLPLKQIKFLVTEITQVS